MRVSQTKNTGVSPLPEEEAICKSQAVPSEGVQEPGSEGNLLDQLETSEPLSPEINSLMSDLFGTDFIKKYINEMKKAS